MAENLESKEFGTSQISFTLIDEGIFELMPFIHSLFPLEIFVSKSQT